MSLIRNVTGLEPAAVAGVDAALTAIEREHRVRIPFAIESGSRAWGFPSPDSDYDCRFLFVRPVAQLVALTPPRDVIELPVEGDLDVNGWELGKALRLLLKGNAVVIEWLMSPVVYRADATFRGELLSFAESFAERERVVSHYLYLGLRQRNLWMADNAPLVLKKMFYVLRPVAALRWLRLHPERNIPPMHFPTLLAESDWPPEAAEQTRQLLERKSVTREMGKGFAPPPLAALIDAELEAASNRLAAAPLRSKAESIEEADRLYRALVMRMDRGD